MINKIFGFLYDIGKDLVAFLEKMWQMMILPSGIGILIAFTQSFWGILGSVIVAVLAIILTILCIAIYEDFNNKDVIKAPHYAVFWFWITWLGLKALQVIFH